MSEERRAVLSSLGANLAVFLLLPLVLNGLIFGLGWNQSTRAAQGTLPGVPPGLFVGALWMVLFAAMAVARWLLLRAGQRRVAESVSLVALLCLLYPLYTSGLSDDRVGLIGNIITAAVAIPVAVMAWRRVARAGVCVAAVCAWLLYAASVTAIGLYR